jgi:hypothetical protein
MRGKGGYCWTTNKKKSVTRDHLETSWEQLTRMSRAAAEVRCVEADDVICPAKLNWMRRMAGCARFEVTGNFSSLHS